MSDCWSAWINSWLTFWYLMRINVKYFSWALFRNRHPRIFQMLWRWWARKNVNWIYKQFLLPWCLNHIVLEKLRKLKWKTCWWCGFFSFSFCHWLDAVWQTAVFLCAPKSHSKLQVFENMTGPCSNNIMLILLLLLVLCALKFSLCRSSRKCCHSSKMLLTVVGDAANQGCIQVVYRVSSRSKEFKIINGE